MTPSSHPPASSPAPEATTLGETATIIPFPACASFPIPPQPGTTLSPDDQARLETIRDMLTASFLAPRMDIEHTCLVIAAEPGDAAQRFGVALFRGLQQYARRQMVFYNRGARERSDDETWLLRLLSAFDSQDEASARALIAWRVVPMGHRRMRFLAAGLAAALRDEPKGH